jgi:predicted amidohydrolase
MSFLVALAQMAPRLADVRGNVERHLQLIEEARDRHVNILLFPELSLAGWALGEASVDVALTLDSSAFADIRRASKELAIGVGLIERASDRVLRNSYLFLDGGTVIHPHRKIHLEDTPAGHEASSLAPGRRIRAFDSRRGRFGILTGADARHVPAAAVLALDSVDALIVPMAVTSRPNADPAVPESLAGWPRALATLMQCHVFVVNRVGTEEGRLFAGSSCAFGPDGSVLAEAGPEEDGLVLCHLDHEATRRVRSAGTGPRDEARDVVLREMGRLIRES